MNLSLQYRLKTYNFSRSRMMKRTSPLNSSCEIKLPRQILLNYETVRISPFSRQRVLGDINHAKVNACVHMHGTWNDYKWDVDQFVEEGSNKKERKEKKREKEKKGREEEGEKEIGVLTVGTRRTKK